MKDYELLGEGGFGNVWRAEQTEVVKREVALKILKLGMDTRQGGTASARNGRRWQALSIQGLPPCSVSLWPTLPARQRGSGLKRKRTTSCILKCRTSHGPVGYDDGCATTAPVMSFKPNPFGLCDMGDNVWEFRGLIVVSLSHVQADGQPMKFISICDYTGIVECEIFAAVYRACGLATIWFPVVQVVAEVSAFDNKAGFTLRVQSVSKPRQSGA